jgi:RNA polymerase sigma factor (sigma-70 family)
MTNHVNQAMAGDRQAFGELVAATYPTVSAITLAITRDPDLSEEATQDVFLAAWLALGRLRNPDSFLPWLRQIARYVARSTARRQHRRAAREVDPSRAAERVCEANRPAEPEASLGRSRERAAIAAAVEALPDEARDCVLLYYYEDLSAERVAELLGVSPAAVRKRLERARRVLREDILRRLGEHVRHAPARAPVTIVAMLGARPADPQAQAVSAAAGLAAIPPAAFGGAAIGLLGSVAGIWRVGRRIGGETGRRFAALGVTLAVLIGCVLPLWLPRLVWLWFATAHALLAWLMFSWLPRHGMRPTRAEIVGWLAAAAAGAVAVAWAMSRMA